MELRPCGCGRWFPADREPVGVAVGTGNPVHMCAVCEQALREMLPPELPPPPRLQPKDRVEVKATAPKPESAPDPYWQGRAAKGAGVNQAGNPYDRRTSAGRNWHRGWTEAGSKA